jgi:hypothetical protein
MCFSPLGSGEGGEGPERDAFGVFCCRGYPDGTEVLSFVRKTKGILTRCTAGCI